MNNSNPKKFRWKLWLTIGGLVVLGAVVVVLATRGSEISYPNITSPRPVAGNADAKVTLTEFSDFQCPACGTSYPVVKSLVEKYGKDFRLEFKHFPLTTIHRNAYNAALAAECANDQSKFWEMHDKLFENQNSLAEADLKKYAQDLNLDTAKFNACLDSRAKKGVVDADIKEANAKKLSGTPTFLLNGQPVVLQTFADLENALRAAIGGVQQGPVK
jgi:protein-disulfide isomerase